jgi:hypothetical protein
MQVRPKTKKVPQRKANKHMTGEELLKKAMMPKINKKK